MTNLRVDSRTVLRSVAEADAVPLSALIDVNRAYLRRWLPWLDANRTVGDTLEFIGAQIAREKEGIGLATLITHDGEVSGVAGFNSIDPVNRCCELGYWLREDRQGRGIATSCCRTLARHAFETLRMNRVNLSAALGNVRSRALADRLGFQQYGVLPDAEWLYDHFVDHALYALLRRDFLSAAKR
jgi:ribosomal-protein-serine acetyltransferase